MLTILKYCVCVTLIIIPFTAHAIETTQKCIVPTNIYTSPYNSQEVRDNILLENANMINGIYQQASDNTISKEEFSTLLEQLLICLNSSVLLGDPVSAVSLAINLSDSMNQEDQKTAHLARVLANTTGDSQIIFKLKTEFFHNLVDQGIIQQLFKNSNDMEIASIFKTTQPSLTNVDNLIEAYEDLSEALPNIAKYLLKTNEPGSIGELMGIISLQEYNANSLQTLETSLEDYLLIADALMNYLQYDASYKFTQKVYSYAQDNGNIQQKEHADTKLAILRQVSNTGIIN